MEKAGRLRFNVSLDKQEPWARTIAKVRKVVEAGDILIHLDKQIDLLMADIDNLYKLDGYFTKTPMFLIMRKDWKWAKKVKECFELYGKTGLIDQLQRKHAKRRNFDLNKEDGETKTKTKTLEIMSILDVILIVFGGGVVAGSLMLSSVLWQMRKMDGNVKDIAT